MSQTGELSLELKGLMLARTILELRGFARTDLDRYNPQMWAAFFGAITAAVALVVCALVPFLAVTASLTPLIELIGKDLHLSKGALELTSGLSDAGYAFGTVMTLDPPRRRRVLLMLGAGSVAAFLVLRGLDVYGDPRHWRGATNGRPAWMNFLNTNKYPASLLFTLMTLGDDRAVRATYVAGRLVYEQDSATE